MAGNVHPGPPPVPHRARTLWLAGVLHGFTHLYNVALMPLYLTMQQDLQLASVGTVTLLVTMMMAAYFLPSYPMGMLADRVSRKKLLGWGLAINGLGFVGLAYAPNYATALACVIVAGFGGSFFHPAATAMVARLCPANTGQALGLVAIGASVGFFLGPLYTGWRANMLEPTLGAAAWRQPVLELGVLGLVMAAVFAGLAHDEPAAPAEARRPSVFTEKLFPTPAVWLFFLAAAFAFSLRDFAGSSMGSLGSLFLQRAHGCNLRETGMTLSVIFIASAISNPLFGHLSDRGRFRWSLAVLICAAALIAVFPHVPRRLLVPTYLLYGFFFMASYPMIEAALMESVPDAVRGRVFGFWITIGGPVGNLAHWLAGKWVQRLGDAADTPAGFFPLYAAMAGLVLLSLLGLPCLRAIRKREAREEAAAPVAVPHTALRTPPLS
jgi:MFS family permease